MLILAVSPSPSLDRTLVVARLVPGGIHRPHLVVETAGGKGLNVARAVAALGGQVTAVAPLGGHAGARIQELLVEADVRCAVVRIAGETRTCTAIAATASGDLTEFYEHAAPLTSADWAQLLDVVTGLLQAHRPSWLVLAGAAPDGIDDAAYADLVAAAHAAGARVALDSHGRALGPAVEAGADLVKVNLLEAAQLVGIRKPELSDAARVLDALAERAADIAVVTLGSNGSAASLAGERLLIRLESRGAYPVGSGDAYLAGLVAGLQDGADPVDALRWAAAAAAANAMSPGAGLLERAAVADLRTAVGVTTLV